MIVGNTHGNQGRKIKLRCRLFDTSSLRTVATCDGMACLSESEWAMLGKSVALSPEDRQPELPVAGSQPRPLEDVVIERMGKRADGPHPLADPFPYFQVLVMINGKERTGVVRGNEFLVPVRPGETYKVWLRNHTGQKVFLRLLVDGLNTLPEPETNGEGRIVQVPCRRMNLEEARPWILDPTTRQKTDQWAVHGFILSDHEFEPFVVGDESKGLITAAFYAPAVRRRRDIFDQVQPDAVGYLLSVVHIRLVDFDLLPVAGD